MSEFAEQIAKLHVHTVEKEAEKYTNDENAQSEISVPPEEVASDHNAQSNNTLHGVDVSNSSPQAVTPHPNRDLISDVLSYLAAAIAIALFALIYKRLLQVYGIL